MSFGTSASASRPVLTDAVPRSPALDAAPPHAPNLVRHPAIPGAGAVRRNVVETMLFRCLTTPLALALVVVQSRFLHPAGRGTFVLAILSVTLFARLLGQLGVAVTHRMSEESVDVRALVDRALVAGTVVSIAGAVAIAAWGWGSGELTGEVAVLAGVALVPTVIWQTICGVLLGLARIRLWNVVQLVPPVFALVGMVVLFSLTGASVRKAVAVWTLAHVVTALFALLSARDTWRPLRRVPLWDGEARRIVRLGLTMGAAQLVNLASYRIELFILVYATTIAQAGVYSIAVQTGESAWLVSGAIASAITASVVRETAERAAALVARPAAAQPRGFGGRTRGDRERRRRADSAVRRLGSRRGELDRIRRGCRGRLGCFRAPPLAAELLLDPLEGAHHVLELRLRLRRRVDGSLRLEVDAFDVVELHAVRVRRAELDSGRARRPRRRAHSVESRLSRGRHDSGALHLQRD